MFHILLVSLFAVCCLGINQLPKNNRIVGGEVTQIENYPYQVSLQRGTRHKCGGSLIAKKWVLTAAHCITRSFYSIRVGSSQRGTDGTVYTVKNQYVHPEYSYIDYDFALIELNEEVTLSDKVQLVKIADAGEEIPTGKMLNISGWGYTSSSASSGSQVLRVVSVPVISHKDCNKVYGDITDRMFCAGYLGVGGKDACQGDSGGPVVADGIQYGIVSFGDECADPNHPGVYSKISNQREWIKKISGV